MMLNEERKSKTDDSVTKEDECDYLRQRYNVLKLVNEKYQEQITSYKTKVQGVESVVLLLKESRQVNTNLIKRNKALEAAVANLQSRLLKNGLSPSLTLQDTELFVPGASKQTLDNLAKENVRLRNLLKNGAGQSEKKFTDEVDELKGTITKLETESAKLKKDVESLEQTISTLSKGKAQSEHERTLNEEKEIRPDAREESVEKVSVECQASDSASETISELRDLLKLTVKQCSHLDEQLKKSLENSIHVEEEKLVESGLKTPVLVDEDYQKLRNKLDEAVLMNQRWHAYSQSQAQRIDVLTENLSEFKKSQEMNTNAASTVHQEEVERLKTLLSSKDAEIQEMRKQTFGLSKEVQYYRKEISNVEILKQQIQVCTEDFNTERKDREQAVGKAKALQDEVIKLKAEIERLKVLNNAELMSRFQSPQQVVRPNVIPIPPRRYELVHERGPSGHYASNLQMRSASTHPPVSLPQQIHSDTASLMPLMPHYSANNNTRLERNVSSDINSPQGYRTVEQAQGSHSMPRQLFHEPNLANLNSSHDMEQNKEKNNLSMPTLSKRGSGTQEQFLACPKCNKEFPEASSADLLTHIDMCNA